MSLIHRKYCFLRAPWVVMRVLIVFLLLWGNTDHLGGKGLLAYKEQSIIEGSQVRNLEVREKTSNKQECCSQTCSPLSAQLFFFFLYILQTPARDAVSYSGMVCPVSINNQENTPETWPKPIRGRQFLNWDTFLSGASTFVGSWQN